MYGDRKYKKIDRIAYASLVEAMPCYAGPDSCALQRGVINITLWPRGIEGVRVRGIKVTMH